MAFVPDASVTACCGLRDEDNALATLAMQRLDNKPARVPAIRWFEVRNVLLVNEQLVNERRRRLTEQDSAAFLQALFVMNIEVDYTPAEGLLLALARTHRLTAYNASYLALALRRCLPLATLDQQLEAAAGREGVSVIG